MVTNSRRVALNGNFGIPINTAPPPPPSPNANTPVRVGDADAGSSYNPATGLIRIVISNSKLRAIDGGATRYQAGSDLAATNVRTYFNRLDPGQRSQNNASDITGDGTYTLGGNAACAPLPVLVRAFSPKTHGAQGSFDVRFAPLPAGALGVEPRRGTGASATTHNVVLAFTAPITFTSASATPGPGGTATVNSTTTNGNEVIVNITASNAQQLTINLLGASAGGPSTTLNVPVGLLRGDTNGDRVVNAADITDTRRQSGQLAVQENYRNEVSVDGVVNSADVTLVRRASGTAIPANP